MGFFDDLKVTEVPLADGLQEILLHRYYTTGDKEARDLLITHNMRLCASAVLEVVSKKLDFDDYMTIAKLELIDILDRRYDPTKGVKFSTFAYESIKLKLLREIEKEQKRSARYVGYEEIPDNYLVKTTKDEDLREVVDGVTEHQLILEFLDTLKEQDRYIFDHTFCLNGEEHLTANEMAEQLGKSYSLVVVTIRQLKKRLKDFILCNGEIPVLNENEFLLEYYNNTGNADKKKLLAHYLGIGDKERKSLTKIAGIYGWSDKYVYTLMDNIRKECNQMPDRDISRQDYLNYMLMTSNMHEVKILGLYLGNSEEDGMPLTAIADEYGLNYDSVTQTMNRIRLKISKLKDDSYLTQRKQLLSIVDIMEYYVETNEEEKRFMELLYGLNGVERLSNHELAEKYKVRVKRINERRRKIEDTIKENLVKKEME